ncbi:hypothetical protein X801_10150, partial [Opisthorchis viverrini]
MLFSNSVFSSITAQTVCGSATVSLESSTKDPVWHPKKETCSSSDTNTTINVNEKLIKGKQEDCGELFIACCTFEAGCSKNITTRVLKSEFNCSHPAEEMWVVLIRYAPQCTYDYEFKWVYGKSAYREPAGTCVAANILACDLTTWLNADTLIENADEEK